MVIQLIKVVIFNFHLVGRYKAAGKTLAQVNRELHSQLARFLKNPDVIVRVLVI